MTKSREIVQEAFRLYDEGYNLSQISRELGVSRMAIRSWFVQPVDALGGHERRRGAVDAGVRRPRETHDGPICPLVTEAPPGEYSYLLGQYLGDGCVSASGPRGVFSLRISTCDDYPEIRQRCVEAIAAVLPGHKIGFVQSEGCGDVQAYSKHWPCLFPQHGPGKKHEGVIELLPWQIQIVEAHPQEFVKGLIESDGSRSINKIHKKKTNKTYEYPRYFFNNTSKDILMLCAWGFDLLGVEWRQNNWNSLSVAKRDSVALLDTFIGPKS